MTMTQSKNSRASRRSEIPKDLGGYARYLGVLPRYMAGGQWRPAKKRTRRHN